MSASIAIGALASISHIIGLGQSNEQGAQAEPVVSGADLGFGALMFDGGVHTRALSTVPAVPEMRPASEFAVKPLTAATQDLWIGETPATGIISQMLRALEQADPTLSTAAPATRHFLYTYPHMGGKHLAELDWRDFETNQSNPNPGPGGYHATFVDDIRRAQATAISAGLSYGIAAFHLTQGENEGAGYLIPGGPLFGHSAFVTLYKLNLAAAYARWDADGRAISGQTSPIPLFISQVDNYWAGQSQAQLAMESQNIFVVGPIYYVPSALNSLWNGTMRGHQAHLSADGQRWRGEQAGKVMARVILEGEDWRPLQPRMTRRVSETSIVLHFDVPRPPIAFETEWLPRALDYGFEVFLGTQDVPGAIRTIANVAITGSDEVTITLDPRTPINDHAASFVTYGQVKTVGTTSGVVTEIRAGAAFSHGAAAMELVFDGDLRAQFMPLLIEGCFVLRQALMPAAPIEASDLAGFLQAVGDVKSASMVARDIRLEGNTTVVRGETRSFENTFMIGVVCSIERDRLFGNLRDSDPAPSMFTFADPTYGLRQGRAYPLHNFCLVFSAAVEV